MRRAALVHINPQRGIVAHERAGRAGMIQVDVREQQRRDVAHRQPGGRKGRVQGRERARRSRVDDRRAAGSMKERSGHDPGARQEVQVAVGHTGSESEHPASVRDE